MKAFKSGKNCHRPTRIFDLYTSHKESEFNCSLSVGTENKIHHFGSIEFIAMQSFENIQMRVLYESMKGCFVMKKNKSIDFQSFIAHLVVWSKGILLTKPKR